MRVDKFLHDMNLGTRTQIRKLVRDGYVAVNGELVKTGRVKVVPEVDLVTVKNEEVKYQEFFYYVLNKPIGVLTATEDRKQKTVMDLFNKVDYRSDLFPVGRLDKDTEGLLLITNNGNMAHRLLSPEHHVTKVYRAVVTGNMDESVIQEFKDGVTLKDGTKLKAAELEILSYSELENQTTVQIKITEGKYHQVRRMFGATGERVVGLRRVAFGPLTLDSGVISGNYRALTDEELEALGEE
ncbi:pseudouridine synthase [Pediococcus argentinicus]|uniref:pseudouridine synthase n=1 Tax=Pediococcus argentinicus TaxID=480391 RepID=UPI00338FF01B